MKDKNIKKKSLITVKNIKFVVNIIIIKKK